MNIYSVYINTNKENSNVLIVKQGFSFVAFIFNSLWALYHRMWAIALLTFSVNMLIISWKEENAFGLAAFIANIAVPFIFGFFATEIREYYARKKGYALDDIICAASEEEAELKYMMRSS